MAASNFSFDLDKIEFAEPKQLDASLLPKQEGTPPAPSLEVTLDTSKSPSHCLKEAEDRFGTLEFELIRDDENERVDGQAHEASIALEEKGQSEPEAIIQQLAKSLYDRTCKSVSHYDAASWIGDSGAERGLVRKSYMDCFHWDGLSVLGAMRGLCNKLYMKAESQQLDRIVDAFSDRWCECNPNHGFKSSSVIYTLAYSILLLNTDLHSEEFSASKKMPRSQYIQSTLQAMATLAFTDLNEDGKEVTRVDHQSQRSAGSKIAPIRPVPSKKYGVTSESVTLVNTSVVTSQKEWESIVSTLLKSVYASVDLTPLNLAIPDEDVRVPVARTSSQSSIFQRRSWLGSNEWSDYDYSDAIAHNSNTSQAKRRSLMSGITSARHSVYVQNGQDHNIGFAGALWNSIISEEKEKSVLEIENETSSSTETVALKSQVDLSATVHQSTVSLAMEQVMQKSGFSEPQVYPTINDIVRKDISITSSGRLHPAHSSYSFSQTSSGHAHDSKREAELMLNGAPWAKEGLLKFQAFFEKDETPKRYKKKGWTSVFVVVQNGYMKMFQFTHGPV